MRGLIIALIVFLVFVLGILGVLLVGTLINTADTDVTVRSPSPILARIVQPAPCDVTVYMSEAKPIVLQYIDTWQRGTVTARIALSPVVGELQTARRRFEAITPPSACSNAYAWRRSMLEMMDHSIDGFISFMGNDDGAGEYQQELAISAMKQANEYLKDINN